MTEGQRYESSVDEWAAKFLACPPKREGFIDVYGKSRMDHNTMKDMYKPIPPAEVEKHKLGSVYFLLPGLATINTILRYTLMPKSGDDRMIRRYSIDMLHHIDELVSFNAMDLIARDCEEDSYRSEALLWICSIHSVVHQLPGWKQHLFA